MSWLADFIDERIFRSLVAEYIWIGGSGKDITSKTAVFPEPMAIDPAKLPQWNCDGSTTDQAPGEDGKAILYPQAIFRDPFRRNHRIQHTLVICDTYYTSAGEPIPTKYDAPNVAKEEPWCGIKQEYTLLQKDTNLPLEGSVGGFLEPKGVDNAEVRRIVDAHHKCCAYAGININPIDGEVIQCGPTVGISATYHLLAARYILERIAETFGVVVSYSFDPKPIQEDWNGGGAAPHIGVEIATDLIPGPLYLDRSEPTNGVVIAEYIWNDGTGGAIRSTARIFPRPVSDPAMLPTWNYQADGEDGEQVILRPQAIYRDPFRRRKNILVICDTYTPAGEPTPTNKRYLAAQIFSHPDVATEEPRFWITQMYHFQGRDESLLRPYWVDHIRIAHRECCAYADISINSYEEYGPAVGIIAGDKLFVSRYIMEILEKIAEFMVSFDPNPTYRFNTTSMRSEGLGSGSGYNKAVKKAIHKFGQSTGSALLAMEEKVVLG